MLFSRNGRQPRGVKGRVQVGYTLAPLTVLLLSGCSSLPGSMNPASWWHDLEGGKIAEERPPPPGADEPYPNLASVPPKPAAPDRAALAKIADALIADRTNAQHVAAAPIADPSSPSASPELFGRGSVPPPGPPPPPGSQQASATMPAAEAPPAPASPPAQGQTGQPTGAGTTAPPPAKAPVANVQSTPLAPPGATAQPPAVAAAAPPALPAAPPPPPNLPGVPSAPSAARSTAPAAPTPPAAPAPPAPTQAAATPPPASAAGPANEVSVTFVSGSADLPSADADTLKQLATRRGAGVIAVTGFGDAASDDPDAQSAALALGLSRAKAMAAALASAGVPASAMQLDAAAVGRGGTARLIQ